MRTALDRGQRRIARRCMLLLSSLFRVFGTGARGALAMKVLASTAAAVGFALPPAVAVAGGLGLPSGVLAGTAGALRRSGVPTFQAAAGARMDRFSQAPVPAADCRTFPAVLAAQHATVVAIGL